VASDLVDETPVERGRRVDRLTAYQQLEEASAPDATDDRDRPARARDQAEVELGETDAGVGRRDDA
jgi:hypothetical protein